MSSTVCFYNVYFGELLSLYGYEMSILSVRFSPSSTLFDFYDMGWYLMTSVILVCGRVRLQAMSVTYPAVTIRKCSRQSEF